VTFLQGIVQQICREKLKETGSALQNLRGINCLTPELNPSAQPCLTRLFTGDFAS
jgi:hypothetical protein